MTALDYISRQDPARIEILSGLHTIIINTDKTVTVEVEKMMGKEMILYKTEKVMKYGLSSVKNWMSLHVMPIYGSTILHDKYKKLFGKAKFQKGCINFKNAEEMPLDIAQELFNDCSKIDLLALIEKIRKGNS